LTVFLFSYNNQNIRINSLTHQTIAAQFILECNGCVITTVAHTES